MEKTSKVVLVALLTMLHLIGPVWLVLPLRKNPIRILSLFDDYDGIFDFPVRFYHLLLLMKSFFSDLRSIEENVRCIYIEYRF